jgi:tocopherol cyclase
MNKIILFSVLFFFSFIFGTKFTLAQESKNETNYEHHSYIPGYGMKKLNNPEIFQGNRKKNEYFEGWYFKMVSNDESSIVSIIPGISLSKKGGKQHAFIQIIDGKTAKTSYFSYPIEAFTFSKKGFAISIGNNYFSKDSIIIDIQNDTTSINGAIHMSDQTNLTKKKKKKKVGIMGWYRFVPFMECYHGVVSLDHNLKGTLKKDNKTYNFNNGKGYIEKDWGKSMPTSWVWLQSNNFSSEKTSFMLSVANVPWMGSSFTGFLGFFLHDNKTYRFGTYTHAKLDMELSSSDTIKIIISDKKHTYKIETYRSKSGILKAPVKGSMDRRISESVDAKLNLTVIDKEGKIIFKDSTSIAGLETVGDIKSLTSSNKKNKSID